MNRIILFSPVGGTDPISQTNCRDGSMLHIVRAYRVTDVYLYLSGEMVTFQEEDDRYRYCLTRLGERQDRKITVHEIVRPDLEDVQLFDTFYGEFREIIRKISGEMDETDELLLNVSSGTPAMKSGLLVLATMGEYHCRTIQVVTPTRRINEHVHTDYDVETLWELNEDNSDNFENRCCEVQCPTLSMLKNIEIIKKHVLAYDYSAALAVAEMMPSNQTKGFIDHLKAAAARLHLDFRTADKICRELSWKVFPLQTSSEKIYFEYALGADIKRQRHEYADFVRALSPLLSNLFVRILEVQASVRLDNYCFFDRRGSRKWDADKLDGTPIGSILGQGERLSFVYTSQLNDIIQNLPGISSDVKTVVSQLRSVEEKVRNMAAHEIVSISDNTITSKVGFNSRHIMDLVKRSFQYAGIAVRKEYWNSYDDMNRDILQIIELTSPC